MERVRLAHDLRNPLTVAVARTQLLQRRLRRGDVSPVRAMVDLDEIEAALVRLRTLIERLDGEAAADDHRPGD
jgi:signal transduction histidine kinase